MKTNIVMKVTPVQSRKVQEIVINHNGQWPLSGKQVLYTEYKQLFISKHSTLSANRDWIVGMALEYQEVDPELFIRTNGTCEEWKPEPGEWIMVWNLNEKDAIKREFVSMSKDGKLYYCHSKDGTYIANWYNAKPAPKGWTDLVSEDNTAICWVWDDDEEDKTVDLIRRVHPKGPDRFGSNPYISWQNAKFIMWAKDAE